MSAHRSDGDVTRLVFATRSGGLAHLLGALRSVVDSEVGLFDLVGTPLVTDPPRALWDRDAVRRARDSPDGEAGFVARVIDVNGSPAAILAVQRIDDREILAVAGDLVALELSRLRAARQGRLEVTEALVYDLLAQRIPESEAVGRLRSVGLDARRPHRVLVGRVETTGGLSALSPWLGIHALLSERPDPFVRIQRGDEVVMIVPEDPMVHRLAQTLVDQLASVGSRARVGVSLAHEGGGGLRAAYYEASAAAQTGAGVRCAGASDLSRVVVMAMTAPLIESARQQLAVVVDYDSAHGTALLETLKVYLDSDRDSAKSCARLYIHRNTLRYRIQQLERLLGTRLDSTLAIANLWLAFLVVEDNAATQPE